MKILFFTSGSVHSNFTHRALTVARGLQALGHEVSLVAPRADKYNNFVSEDVRQIDGVRIVQPFQFNTKQAALNLLPYMLGAGYQAFKSRPDIVYIYKPTPVSVVGLLAKLFWRSKVVLDMDDLGSEVMRIEGHPAYMRMLVAASERLAACFADRIVVASTYLAHIYKKQYPNTPRHLMPNAVGASWLEAPVLPSEVPMRVVFMGAINRKNILEPLFDAFAGVLKKHPQAQALIIGDGSCLAYFKEKAEKLGIEKNITFTGWLALDYARAKLKAGDVGYSLMPDVETNRAASNMKVPQYMARGVVPFVSDVGDLAATVDRGNAGYILKDLSPEAVERALIGAFEDEDRPAKARAARAYAAAHLNWEDLVAGFGEWLAPRRAAKPKVYMLTISVPGNVGGGEVRNINLIKQLLKKITPDVTVFSVLSHAQAGEKRNLGAGVAAALVAAPPFGQSPLWALYAVLLARVPPFLLYFKKSGMGESFRKACEESLPDVVQIEQLHSYYCVRGQVARLKSRGVKIVFDCHNIEYRAFGDSLAIFPFFKRLAGLMLVPHLKRLEIEAATHADLVIACSQEDAEFFRRYNPNTHVVANGVDTSEFSPAPQAQEPVLIFMGGVGYPPNGDGLEFYLRDIHPKIKERVPGLKLLAIGATAQWLSPKGIADPSVEPLGFVDDVRPYLARSAVGICPVRVGSGTRIKILTYMAAGLAVVSTAKGAEGVGYAPGEHILLADDPRDFADAVARLIGDPALRLKIAEGGNAFVRERYDWEVIGKELASAYERII